MNEEQVMHAMGIDDAYRVVRVLADGRGGTTELVTIDGSGPLVRKKIPSKLANRGVWAALAGSTCPRLPRVAGTYEMPDRFAVVYDYTPGDTLEQRMAAIGSLAPKEAATLICQVAEAVGALHALGVIHRDLSPANIIVAADGAHLVDFGIARLIAQEDAPGSKALGTWGFASPEQHGFSKADERSDIYSMGRLLGYVLTGARPDDEAYERELADAEVVPGALRAVIERASSFEPSVRYQGVPEFSEAVRRAAADAGEGVRVSKRANAADVTAGTVGGGAPSGWVAVPTRGGAGKRIALVAAVLVALAVAAAAAWFALVGGGASEPPADTRRQENVEKPVVSGDERSDADAASDAASGEDAAGDILTLVESGWSVSPHGYIHYGFALENASETTRVDLPGVRITGRDEDGAVLFTDTQYLMGIMPGETAYFGAQAGDGAAPATVEFSVIEPEDYKLVQTSSEPVSFIIENLAEVEGDLGSSFSGEVTMRGEPEDNSVVGFMGQIAVSVILRDEAGKIVYGETTYVDGMEDGATLPFQTLSATFPDYATVEAHAQIW